MPFWKSEKYHSRIWSKVAFSSFYSLVAEHGIDMLLGFFRRISLNILFLAQLWSVELAVWDVLILPSGKFLTITASSKKTLMEFFKCLSSMYVKDFQLWVAFVMYVKHFSTRKIFQFSELLTTSDRKNMNFISSWNMGETILSLFS